MRNKNKIEEKYCKCILTIIEKEIFFISKTIGYCYHFMLIINIMIIYFFL